MGRHTTATQRAVEEQKVAKKEKHKVELTSRRASRNLVRWREMRATGHFKPSPAPLPLYEEDEGDAT